MSDNDKLRSMADTWIVVVTIFLAIELTAVTFTIAQTVDPKEISDVSKMYLGSAMVTVALTGLSMIIFIAAKDPRMQKYSVATLVDKGVLVMLFAVISCSITLGIGAKLITTLDESFALPFLISGITIGMYLGFYRRYIHGKKIGS